LLSLLFYFPKAHLGRYKPHNLGTIHHVQGQPGHLMLAMYGTT